MNVRAKFNFSSEQEKYQSPRLIAQNIVQYYGHKTLK